jgi:hypothetical protein
MLDILLPSVQTAFPGLNSPRRMFSSFRLRCLRRAVLLVLLSTPQYLKVACLLSKELLGRPDEASGAPLLDLVLRDQVCLLGLDDLLSGPGAGLRGPASTFSGVVAETGGVTNFLGAAVGLDFLTAP